MKTMTFLAAAAMLAATAVALADAEERREMKIVVEAQSDDGSPAFSWVSDDPNLDMEAMQVGETQSIVDESGRAVLITREAEGFRFDVDGKSILMPEMGSQAMATFAMADGSDLTADFDVEVIGDHRAMAFAGESAVTIITGEALDASTQESIKAVLQSVGRGDEVTFIDNSGAGNGRHVSIIRKEVEIQ
jgi:hypothetical protein